MGFRYFRWFLKDMGKRPNGPRLPIGAEGGQVVLDSLLQTPLGLQDQDAPAVRKAYRRMLFSSGCSSCLNPAGCTNTSVWRSARTAFAHAEGGGGQQAPAQSSVRRKWSNSSS